MITIEVHFLNLIGYINLLFLLEYHFGNFGESFSPDLSAVFKDWILIQQNRENIWNMWNHPSYMSINSVMNNLRFNVQVLPYVPKFCDLFDCMEATLKGIVLDHWSTAI